MMFRGRELMHRDLGKDIVERMVVDMKEHGTPESAPSMEGKTMYVVLNPNADK